MIASFRDVVALWGSPDALAADIGAGVSAARKWSQRDSIPSEWWKAIVQTPKAEAAGVTTELLTDLAARPIEAAEARA